jgi:NACalpha-BTF3-like transcription factor
MTILLIFVTGCSKWSGGGPRMPYEPSFFSKVFKSSKSDGGVHKEIAVAPFQMTSHFGDPALKISFQKDLIKAVKAECPSVIYINSNDVRYPDVLFDLPKLPSGDIDNYRLAMAGRQFGLFGIIVGTITSINVDSKDKGYWVLRSTDYFIQVEVLIEIYSMETAAKLYDRAFSERVKVDETDVEVIRSQNKIDESFVKQALKNIIGDLKGGICHSIHTLDWKSYIVSRSDENILIAAGERSGIRVGQILNVYENNRTIKGFREHQFAITGDKIGEIEVTAVREDHSRAIPISGNGFQSGQTVGMRK